MTPVTLNDRDRRALVRGALVVLVAALYTLGVRPSRERRAQLLEQLDAERAVLARERALVARRSQPPREPSAAAAKQLFAGADAVIASSSLAEYVATAADAHNVWVQQTVTRSPDGGASRRAANAVTGADLEVTVRADGDLGGLLQWLRALEVGAMPVAIQQLDVSANAPEADAAPLTFSAVVRSYARHGGSR